MNVRAARAQTDKFEIIDKAIERIFAQYRDMSTRCKGLLVQVRYARFDNFTTRPEA